MGKPDVTNQSDDEAKEKMLDDGKLTSACGTPEVIFMSENGKTKINDENLSQVLSGMCKEELMSYANNSFWIKLRWLLFIGFWILWFAMLAGAALIIIGAPKCTSTSTKKWWAKSPIVQLEPLNIIGKNNGISIEALLDNLKKQNIDIISLSSILSETSKNHVTDFNSLNSNITIKDLAYFIDAAKNRSQKVIMEFDINYSSVNHSWFVNSIERIEPYTNYYIWSDGKNGTEPPNNWLSIKNGSAWEWNDKRKQYYLHQFEKTQPELNFSNPLVVDEFTKTLINWIKFGFNGFRLGGTQYLTEDPNKRDEIPIRGPARSQMYESFNHVHTKDRHADNILIIAKLRNAVENITNNEGLFAFKDDTGDDAIAIFDDNKVKINLPQRSNFISTIDNEITAETLQKGIIRATNGEWPGWNFNGDDASLRSRLGDSTADSLILMSLLLPGTPILKLNDCLNDTSAFPKVTAKRNEDTFLYGNFKPAIINGTVFTYIRIKSGHPGYLIAYQSSDNQVDIDVTSMPFKTSELTVLAHSRNYNRNVTSFAEKMSPKKIPISPKSTLILSFINGD